MNLPLPDIYLLVASSFIGSVLTAALGVGGGAFLITMMAGVVPPLALIPLHGVVQMGSNASRALHSRKHLNISRFGYFMAGALVASLATFWLIGQIDVDLIPLMVAVFVLWLVWVPMPDFKLGTSPAGLLSGGILTTLASMLVGASGPLVSAWLGRTGHDKWQYTALFSTCMTAQHLLKIIVFGFAGFVFSEWLGLLALMLLAAYLGTRVGLKMLGKLPEAQFKTLFRWMLTLLSIRLIWQWYGL
ncbi:MAG: putative membrane protein YfcA [Thalassolituus sp.]|jgi:uncharacterized membrane protein YfcA